MLPGSAQPLARSQHAGPRERNKQPAQTGPPGVAREPAQARRHDKERQQKKPQHHFLEQSHSTEGCVSCRQKPPIRLANGD